MPIWLRKFVFKQIAEHYESEGKSQQDNNVQKSIDAMKSAGFTSDKVKTNKPVVPPSYVTKASKK